MHTTTPPLLPMLSLIAGMLCLVFLAPVPDAAIGHIDAAPMPATTLAALDDC